MIITRCRIHKHRVQANVEKHIGRIVIGIRRDKLTDSGRPLRRIVVIENDVPRAVAEDVAILELTPGAVLKSDSFPVGKSDDGAVECHRG